MGVSSRNVIAGNLAIFPNDRTYFPASPSASTLAETAQRHCLSCDALTDFLIWPIVHYIVACIGFSL